MESIKKTIRELKFSKINKTYIFKRLTMNLYSKLPKKYFINLDLIDIRSFLINSIEAIGNVFYLNVPIPKMVNLFHISNNHYIG